MTSRPARASWRTRSNGVTIGPSPLWMQLRLLAIGQRPISNVVDVSNYVMWELGHPIHTFDADAIAERHIIIRRALAGETLDTLDGVERALRPGDILVTDPSGPVALAGVMGGASTEVSGATTNILVEAANWHPPSILFTSHRLGLRSEASARFERGVDPNLSGLATARTVELIASTAGGVPRAGAVDSYPVPVLPWEVRLDARDVSRLLGAGSFVRRVARATRPARFRGGPGQRSRGGDGSHLPLRCDPPPPTWRRRSLASTGSTASRIWSGTVGWEN